MTNALANINLDFLPPFQLDADWSVGRDIAAAFQNLTPLALETRQFHRRQNPLTAGSPTSAIPHAGPQRHLSYPRPRRTAGICLYPCGSPLRKTADKPLDAALVSQWRHR